MNAMQKVAWFELIVTSAAVAATVMLIPWLGDGAWGAFGLLGLLGLCVLFVRPKGGETVYDERDREIDLRAIRWGIGAAWQFTFMTLIVITFWSAFYNDNVIPTRVITWLVWLQFALCYWVKGAVALLSYRGRADAA